LVSYLPLNAPAENRIDLMELSPDFFDGLDDLLMKFDYLRASSTFQKLAEVEH